MISYRTKQHEQKNVDFIGHSYIKHSYEYISTSLDLINAVMHDFIVHGDHIGTANLNHIAASVRSVFSMTVPATYRQK